MSTNKQIVKQAHEVLKAQGHQISTGHLYELFSKLSGHNSWNHASAAGAEFKEILADAPKAQAPVVHEVKELDPAILAVTPLISEFAEWFNGLDGRTDEEHERTSKAILSDDPAELWAYYQFMMPIAIKRYGKKGGGIRIIEGEYDFGEFKEMVESRIKDFHKNLKDVAKQEKRHSKDKGKSKKKKLAFPMSIEVPFDADALIDDIMANFPEASTCVRCTGWDYKNCEFNFIDEEDTYEHPAGSGQQVGKEYIVTRPMLRVALKSLLQTLFEGHLPGIGQYVLVDFKDAGNWDRFAADALVQTAIFGGVIYG